MPRRVQPAQGQALALSRLRVRRFGDQEAYQALLGRLGKHSLGNGGCLNVNKLAHIDLSMLEQKVALGWRSSFERYPAG